MSDDLHKKRIEHDTEKIARRMAKQSGCPEALWEMFLSDAYQEYYKLSEAPNDPT